MMHAEHISHTQQSSNFTFLKPDYVELFRLGSEMEFYASQDHSCALLKARLFCELWCQEVAHQLHIKLPYMAELCQVIKTLERSSKLPVFIIDALNEVRQAANGLMHVYQNGSNIGKAHSQITAKQLEKVFLTIFDLAQFLAFDINKAQREQLSWQAPVVADLVHQVSLALNGNPDANLALADAAYKSLVIIKEQKAQHTITKSNKSGYQLNQQDLSFWLQRAQTLNAKGAWLLFAKSLANKLIEPTSHITVNECFQNAVAECETGEALAEQAGYAFLNQKTAWGWTLIEKSAELGFHTAITCMQAKYKNDELQLAYWTEKGVEHKEPNSFTVDAFVKLEYWLNNQTDELAQKRARSAFITAQATNAPGGKYLKAYCDYFGYWGRQGDNSALEELIESANELPDILVYQTRLFEVLLQHPEQHEKAIKVGGEALLNSKCAQERAKLKYELAMLMHESLNNHGKVKAHFPLKRLLKESANAGYEKAIQFLNLPKGKALMRDNSVCSHSLKFKTPDRKKQKRAKKQARKAKKK